MLEFGRYQASGEYSLLGGSDSFPAIHVEISPSPTAVTSSLCLEAETVRLPTANPLTCTLPPARELHMTGQKRITVSSLLVARGDSTLDFPCGVASWRGGGRVSRATFDAGPMTVQSDAMHDATPPEPTGAATADAGPLSGQRGRQWSRNRDEGALGSCWAVRPWGWLRGRH